MVEPRDFPEVTDVSGGLVRPDECSVRRCGDVQDEDKGQTAAVTVGTVEGMDGNTPSETHLLAGQVDTANSGAPG